MKNKILFLMVLTLTLGFGYKADAATTAVAKTHNGTDAVTVNVNEPVFLYAKDSTGGTGSDYLSLRDFEWDFNSLDGINYGDSISSFTYNKYSSPGTYTITLKITDDQGGVGTDSVTVIVQDVPAGETFYVTKSGNDSKGCTNNTTDACLTIGGALEKTAVGAGDAIIIGAGSYDETIVMNKSGTANKPITVKAADGTTPEIYHAGPGRLLNFNGHDYITFDGFEFDGRSIADAIHIPNNSIHCSIRNSEIHHIGNSSYPNNQKANSGLSLSVVRSSDHKNAQATWAYIYNTSIHNNATCNINVSTWGNVFENVTVKDPGLIGSGEDNYVVNSAGHGNYFKGGENGRTNSEQDAHQDAWELYGASNVTIEGMKIYNSEAELIMCDAAIRPATDMCDNLVFINNLVYRNYPVDQQQLKLRCGYNFRVLNNTFYGRLDPIVLDTCQNSNGNSDYGVSANNIFMGSGSNSCSNDYGSYQVIKTNNSYYNCNVSSGEANVKTANPQISNPKTDGTGDFSLTSSSPCINSGIDTGYPIDYAGNRRSSYDIGAYEYSGSTASNPPPATCSDGIRNQDETGVDCGGVCPACPAEPEPEPEETYDLSNFIALVSDWLGSGNSVSDVNNDGIVNTRDLGIIMSNWSN